MPPESVNPFIEDAFHKMRLAREAFIPQLKLREVGRIENISTGIATINGLPGVGL